MRMKVVTLKDNLEKFKDYKLCFIDEIPEQIYDYSPSFKEYMKTEEFKKKKEAHDKMIEEIMKEKGSYAYDPEDPYYKEMDTGFFPNPEYNPETSTHYAYFTSNLEKQWGDDWDDTPYEHNAGTPYENEGTEIISVPFKLRLYIKLPKDWELDGRLRENYHKNPNSPFSVKTINSGAVPWLADTEKAIFLMAGANPEALKWFLDKTN